MAEGGRSETIAAVAVRPGVDGLKMASSPLALMAYLRARSLSIPAVSSAQRFPTASGREPRSTSAGITRSASEASFGSEPRFRFTVSSQSASKQQNHQHDDDHGSYTARIPTVTVMPGTIARCADECEDQEDDNENPEQIHSASLEVMPVANRHQAPAKRSTHHAHTRERCNTPAFKLTHYPDRRAQASRPFFSRCAR